MAIANVLLVDDEVPFVEAMTRRLNKRNVKIATAFSGSEALDVLSEDSSIEVVVLDVKMPGMDGIETLAEIRKKFPLQEVIMLSVVLPSFPQEIPSNVQRKKQKIRIGIKKDFVLALCIINARTRIN